MEKFKFNSIQKLSQFHIFLWINSRWDIKFFKISNFEIQSCFWDFYTKSFMWKVSIHYCRTRLHLGFSAKLRIWQVSACKMEPRSGTKITGPASHPPPSNPSTEPKCSWINILVNLVWINTTMNLRWPTVDINPFALFCQYMQITLIHYEHKMLYHTICILLFLFYKGLPWQTNICDFLITENM